MERRSLFSVGHGNRKQEDFLALLNMYNIKFLIDVRSQPFSKFNPQFNQNEIKYFLEKNGIKYIFMGDSIGGRPKDKSCYDSEGKVDYDQVKTKDFFLDGIQRLKIANEKELNVVIMCSESKPCECHRSKLIGRVLSTDNIILNHIDENGKVKDQITVINELNKGRSEIDLFGESLNMTSRNSYR